jgi:uncharacterized membrane protein
VELLVALGAFLVISPLLSEDGWWRLPSALLFVGVIGASLHVVGNAGRHLIVPGATGVAAFVLEIAAELTGRPPLSIASRAIFGLYLAIVVALLLRGILRAQQVTSNAIAGGVCVYVLIGMMWAAVFTSLEMFQPGSFVRGSAQLGHQANGLYVEMLYFSYVTVATVGYGDIVGATPIARMLAVVAALSGQLYLAVFVAGLVGLVATQGRASRGE